MSRMRWRRRRREVDYAAEIEHARRQHIESTLRWIEAQVGHPVREEDVEWFYIGAGAITSAKIEPGTFE